LLHCRKKVTAYIKRNVQPIANQLFKALQYLFYTILYHYTSHFKAFRLIKNFILYVCTNDVQLIHQAYRIEFLGYTVPFLLPVHSIAYIFVVRSRINKETP
jgi:hypothetical protein